MWIYSEGMYSVLNCHNVAKHTEFYPSQLWLPTITGIVEVEVTLLLTVSQYVFVSSTLVGLATRYYFLSECCCLKFAVLFLWSALSEVRTGLQFAV
jgi:hypothetical protein